MMLVLLIANAKIYAQQPQRDAEEAIGSLCVLRGRTKVGMITQNLGEKK